MNEQYSSSIGALGPYDSPKGGGTTGGVPVKKDNTTLITSILGVVTTVLGAVLGKKRDSSVYENPFPGPTDTPPQPAISTTTLIIGAALVLLFLKKK